MYLKVTGAVLVWGGCTAWGFCVAARQRRRLDTMEELARALAHMERELALRCTPLPTLLRQTAQFCTAQGRRLFQTCATEIEKGNDFTSAWRRATAQMDLLDGARGCLNSVGCVLGQYQAQEQVRSLIEIRGQLEEILAGERARQEQMLRLYSMLGMTAGGFLALMLL